MSQCEAEERNKRALHQLELDWGAGMFDYRKIQRILRGDSPAECDHEAAK